MELDEGDWYPAEQKPKLSIVDRYQIAWGPGLVALRILASDAPNQGGKIWGAQLGLSAHDCRLLGQHLLDAAELLDGAAGPQN